MSIEARTEDYFGSPKYNEAYFATAHLHPPPPFLKLGPLKMRIWNGRNRSEEPIYHDECRRKWCGAGPSRSFLERQRRMRAWRPGMRSLGDVPPPESSEEFFGNLALFTDAYFAIASTLPPPSFLKLPDDKLAIWKGTSGFDELTEDAYRRTWVGARRSPAYQARIDQRDADEAAIGEVSCPYRRRLPERPLQ